MAGSSTNSGWAAPPQVVRKTVGEGAQGNAKIIAGPASEGSSWRRRRRSAGEETRGRTGRGGGVLNGRGSHGEPETEGRDRIRSLNMAWAHRSRAGPTRGRCRGGGTKESRGRAGAGVGSERGQIRPAATFLGPARLRRPALRRRRCGGECWGWPLAAAARIPPCR